MVQSPDTLDYHSPRGTRWWACRRCLRFLGLCFRLTLLVLSSTLGLLLIFAATFIAVTPQSRELWEGHGTSFTPRGAAVWRQAHLTLNEHALNLRVINYRGETLDGTPTIREAGPYAGGSPHGHRRWLNLPVPPPKFDRWGVRYEDYLGHQDRDWYETLTKLTVRPSAIVTAGFILLLPLAVSLLMRGLRHRRSLQTIAS